MNYIYDIVLNFNKEIYEFYEWNKLDKISHIKKIPIFKIDSEELKKIIFNNIEFDNDFLNQVDNLTILYNSNKRLKYAFILTDGIYAVGININKDILYSRFLIDEENEILDLALHLKETQINYKIKNSRKINMLETRLEKESKLKILKKINNIKDENELKYIYYDCFDEKCDNVMNIKKAIINNMNNEFIVKKLNNFLNIKNI